MMTSLSKRRIVLVGGAGFIGHNLALKLTRLGACVSIIDNLQVNNLQTFAAARPEVYHRDLYLQMINQRLEMLHQAGVVLVTQDARDEAGMMQAFARLRPEVVVHLAGIAHANRCNVEPQDAFEHTLCTLQNCLELTRTPGASIDHVVYFSSSMVYGHFPAGMVTEETPCDPIGVYGALKLAGEKMVVSYNQVFGTPYTIIRPSALYGERCVSRRVVQVFVEKGLEAVKLTVDGDGSDRLDFTYIDDLVQGIVRVLESESARNQTFNITAGRSRSISELLGLLREEFGDLEVQHQAKDRLMPDRGTLCVDKARTLLGYDPQFPLERGLPKYIDWYRSLRLWRCAPVEPLQLPRRQQTLIAV